MRQESSPFLHRSNVVSRGEVYSFHDSRAAIKAERERGRITLEKLRYRWWAKRGTLARHMQIVGDFGRKYFGWIDPRQTGGGWW